MNKIFEVKDICEQLQSTNSKKDKESILLKNISNEVFREVLFFLLNPFILTGISSKKINKSIGKFPKVNYTELLTYDNDDCHFDSTDIRSVFRYLLKNNTGRDFDISVCECYFTNFESDMQEFIKSILTKSLKLGIDAVTANKVFGDGFIPTFDVMLGTSIEKCKIPEGDWFSISHKLNGTRNLFYKGDFHTRQGRKYTGLDHIKNDLLKLVTEDLVVDGELIRKNSDGLSDSENFQVGTGIANSKSSDKSELKLVIFDCITVKEFEQGKSKTTYRERKKFIDGLRSKISELKLENVSIVDMFYEGDDQSEIWKWLDYAEEHDLEGIIVNLDAPYECKRTKNLIKVKKFADVDLLCTGIENGTGRNKNTLGAIVCQYKGFEIKVGSGFSDAQRNFYYNNPDEIVGKIVTVKYKEETKNKNGGVSLQFPVFQAVRFDKLDAD